MSCVETSIKINIINFISIIKLTFLVLPFYLV